MTLDNEAKLPYINDQVPANAWTALQSTLGSLQERTTTLHRFLEVEYNSLSERQLRTLVGLSRQTCRASQDISCWGTVRRP